MRKYTPEESLLRAIFADKSLPEEELAIIDTEQRKELKKEAIGMLQKIKTVAKDFPDMAGVDFRAALLYELPTVVGDFDGKPHFFIILGESLGRVPLDSYDLNYLIIV